jgi:hypothetical protein
LAYYNVAVQPRAFLVVMDFPASAQRIPDLRKP